MTISPASGLALESIADVDPGPLGGDARRAPAPARQDRADRERELHLGRGHGSPGLVAHEQVRRGPARQALLRRLRVRRHRRAARPGARPRSLPRRRARQRPAALRRPGEHGRLLQRPRAGRPDHGHEPRPRRPPDPRHGAQLLGPALRGPCLRRPPGHRADRLRRDGGAGQGGPPEAHRRWRVGVSADLGLRADGVDRRGCRGDPVHRHGPHRGPRRGRRPSEPVPARRPRDDDDPQDAPRATRRDDLQPPDAPTRPRRCGLPDRQERRGRRRARRLGRPNDASRASRAVR